jgi:uncharacterized phage protein (TIGR01671 family)
MKREILFRGKRVDNGEWVDGMLAYFFDNPKNAMIMPTCYFGTRDFGGEDEKGNPIIEDEMAMGGFINVIPETVGQFTGITDKNGGRIFEGDLIEVCENKNGPLTVEFVNAYVGGWVLSHNSTDQKLSLGARKQSKLQITGNIHDK